MKQDLNNVTIQLLSQYGLNKKDNVLEVGCGDGRLTREIALRVAYLTAIDTDENILSATADNIPEVRFELASGENLPFSEKLFDTVIFTLSLHHQCAQTALKEAFRVTKQNGRIIVIEPCTYGQIEKICNIYENEDEKIIQTEQIIKSFNSHIITAFDFEAEWKFRNKNELFSWLSDYYKSESDMDKKSKVESFIKYSIDENPLVLKDNLRFTVLKK